MNTEQTTELPWKSGADFVTLELPGQCHIYSQYGDLIAKVYAPEGSTPEANREFILSRCNEVMNANTYQQLAKRTLIDKPPFELNDEQIMLTWNALGLTGEAGEVAESIKKGIYHQHGLDVAKLTNELGDVLWYVAALCSILHVDMSSIMQQNIDKLKARYPNGFNSQDSIKRIDTHTL